MVKRKDYGDLPLFLTAAITFPAPEGEITLQVCGKAPDASSGGFTGFTVEGVAAYAGIPINTLVTRLRRHSFKNGQNSLKNSPNLALALASDTLSLQQGRKKGGGYINALADHAATAAMLDEIRRCYVAGEMEKGDRLSGRLGALNAHCNKLVITQTLGLNRAARRSLPKLTVCPWHNEGPLWVLFYDEYRAKFGKNPPRYLIEKTWMACDATYLLRARAARAAEGRNTSLLHPYSERKQGEWVAATGLTLLKLAVTPRHYETLLEELTGQGLLLFPEGDD